MLKVKIHWNIQKARKGIYEYSVCERKAGARVTKEFGTNNLRLENASLHLVESAWKKSVETNTRKVFAQVYGELVEFAPIEGGREISCNPLTNDTPNFYFVDTGEKIPFGYVGSITFEVRNGRPICKIV